MGQKAGFIFKELSWVFFSIHTYFKHFEKFQVSMTSFGSEHNIHACLQKPDMVWFNAAAISWLLWQSLVGQQPEGKSHYI